MFTQGTTISQVQENLEPLESALGKRITRVEPGEGNQSIRLHLAPGNTKLPEVAYLPQGQLSKPPEILLGESLDGPVTWDPDKVPHLLVGGSTGSGKTTLVKSIIFQFVCMTDSDGKPAAEVYISDLKGGLDYPSRWRNQDCSFGVTAGDTLSMSSQLVKELNHRKDMYHQVSNLATIARLGRAFGIHLVVSTQRPDAMLVPGQIKNNLDGRICGKADNVLSQIILDSTDAADRIPKDSQGLFLDQDGALFHGYLFDDKTILPERDTRTTP